MTTTVGIDLAADAKKTAIAEIAWGNAEATLKRLKVGVDDADLLAEIRGAEGRVGIDCPFGWPTDFKELVGGHPTLRTDNSSPRWRGTFTHRLTDHWVREKYGVQPLSVSADKLGHVAIRLSAIIARLEPAEDFPLDGSGRIAEVYPAAALHAWDLPHRQYKRPIGSPVRAELVAELERAGISFGAHAELARRSDDAFDAVVSAVVVRAVGTQLVDPPDVSQRPFARTEGWIHVPKEHSTANDIVRLDD